jgi:hypothetical protein
VAGSEANYAFHLKLNAPLCPTGTIIKQRETIKRKTIEKGAYIPASLAHNSNQTDEPKQ